MQTWISGWTVVDADFFSRRSIYVVDGINVTTFIDTEFEFSSRILTTHTLHTQFPWPPFHDIRLQHHPQRTIPNPRKSSRVHGFDHRNVRSSMVPVNVCCNRCTHRVNVTSNMGPSHDGRVSRRIHHDPSRSSINETQPRQPPRTHRNGRRSQTPLVEIALGKYHGRHINRYRRRRHENSCSKLEIDGT